MHYIGKVFVAHPKHHNTCYCYGSEERTNHNQIVPAANHSIQLVVNLPNIENSLNIGKIKLETGLLSHHNMKALFIPLFVVQSVHIFL